MISRPRAHAGVKDGGHGAQRRHDVKATLIKQPSKTARDRPDLDGIFGFRQSVSPQTLFREKQRNGILQEVRFRKN